MKQAIQVGQAAAVLALHLAVLEHQGKVTQVVALQIVPHTEQAAVAVLAQLVKRVLQALTATAVMVLHLL
jgi:hypothetical protein